MEAKHTPGPWTWDGDHIRSGERLVAVVALRDGLITDAQEREDTANARLIAAAPDLLEALMTLPQTMFWSDDDLWKWSEKANAAIAKATGENR